MRILLSVQSDLTAPCRLHQSRHEESENCLRRIDALITLHQREHIKPILEVKRVKRNE